MRLFEFDQSAFDAWFAGSKAVDASGNPLKLYHGTSKDVDFKSFKMGKRGIWLTPSTKEASNYASDNDSMGAKYDHDVRGYVKTNVASRVIPVYLSAKNPKMFSSYPDELRLAQNYGKAQGEYFDKLRSQGYDSVFIGSVNNLDQSVWVALSSPSQVKSAVSAKTFDHSKKNMTEDRIDELNYPREKIKSSTRKTANAMMQSLGFEIIGEASYYANVYANPNLNYVVKIFDVTDFCYPKFVDLAKSHGSNPHFPMFRGSMMRISDMIHGVRMERLHPTTNDMTDTYLIKKSIRQYIRDNKVLPYNLVTTFPDLQIACDLIAVHSSGCRIDLHEGNIMFRGDTPVIIDPYADKTI